MADWRETEGLKPIDKADFGLVSESPGRNGSERRGGLEKTGFRRPSPRSKGEGSMSCRRLAGEAALLRRGGSGGTVARGC